MKIRNVGALNSLNNAAHSRSLIDSIMMPEVISALRDWAKVGAGGVLVGTAALCFHVRPRMTQELEFLFLAEIDVPSILPGFDRIRPALFRHREAGVEVKIVTPATIEITIDVAQAVVRTATVSDGVRVASENGLVALKLFRLSRQDEADVIALLKTVRVDLLGFKLPPEGMAAFQTLVGIAATDPHPP